VLNDFARNYKMRWSQMMCAKIGFDSDAHEAKLLSERLLAWMLENKADYTNTYLLLSDDVSSDQVPINDDLKHWLLDWKREVLKHKSWDEVLVTMRKANPQVIPRNDKVEAALDAAVHQKDYSKIQEIIAVIKNPNHANKAYYQRVSAAYDTTYQTFCGT